jgi:hypothetical protein
MTQESYYDLRSLPTGSLENTQKCQAFRGVREFAPIPPDSYPEMPQSHPEIIEPLFVDPEAITRINPPLAIPPDSTRPNSKIFNVNPSEVTRPVKTISVGSHPEVEDSQATRGLPKPSINPTFPRSAMSKGVQNPYIVNLLRVQKKILQMFSRPKILLTPEEQELKKFDEENLAHWRTYRRSRFWRDLRGSLVPQSLKDLINDLGNPSTHQLMREWWNPPQPKEPKESLRDRISNSIPNLNSYFSKNDQKSAINKLQFISKFFGDSQN